MVKMPDTTATAKSQHEVAADYPIAPVQKKGHPGDEVSLVPVKKPRAGFLHSLGKLKPLLPILSGGLRLVDHGVVQALAQLLNFADGASAAQSAAQEELHQGLSEIQSSHRELHLQVQDQTVEMRRIEDQIVLLRQAAERNATEHTELVRNVQSLSNLVRVIGAGLAILLVILITLAAILLTHHS